MDTSVSHTVEASDGLRLHVRQHGLADTGGPTVLCLPGLARTAADFERLAAHLLGRNPNIRILALDYRGRGASAWDPDPNRYDIPVELDDILAVCHALEVSCAVLVGTSRGGLHTMMLAAMRPALLLGAVLNDIGPVIERTGLERIRGYVGKLPEPRSWDEAVTTLKAIAGAQFTGIGEHDWLSYAQTTFAYVDGRFHPRYDPALMHNVAKLDLGRIPTLWPQFEALAAVPVLVIRGANSDLLSAETAQAMVARLPDCALVTVPGQGHAPLLYDETTLASVAAFVQRCFSARHGPQSVRPAASPAR